VRHLARHDDQRPAEHGAPHLPLRPWSDPENFKAGYVMRSQLVHR
jgi:hypothetical protein